MAVLKRTRERQLQPWQLAKREADKKILDERVAEYRREDAERFRPVFNPMDVAWGNVKPQPLPVPVKRTRKRAA